jgi:hypothetical protein
MNRKAEAMAQPDSWEYVQKIFGDSWNQGKIRRDEIRRNVLCRKSAAYFLKGVAVFGGIAIAAGLPETVAHGVGIAITVAVALDYLVTNQVKLVTFTKAYNAYKHLLRDTANEHSTKLAQILSLKKTDPERAKEQLNKLNVSLKGRIDAESKKIELAIDETDVKALDALSLEKERQGSHR